MIKHSEIEVPEKNPFENCQLNREQYSSVLTDIVSNYKDGFVLAINNKWGTGKTTFIRMWNQSLRNSGYKTILFNAWENDFENNPMIAFIGELKAIVNEKNKNSFKEIVKKAAELSKAISPAIAKGLTKKYVGIDLEDIAEKTTEVLIDLFKKDVEEYIKKRENLNNFKKQLLQFVNSNVDKSPLIIIIDELDRCRPDYAVLVLEQIKHFFNVPNIVFVLSIDKEQLGNAICGAYGSDRIDSNEYLRRFIDIEYTIPDPDIDSYVEYLFNYYNYDEFFKDRRRTEHYILRGDGDAFLRTAKELLRNNSLTLRQIENIFSHARLSLNCIIYKGYVLPEFFFLMIFLRVIDFQLYKKIKSKIYSLEDIQKEVKKYFNTSTGTEVKKLVYLEAFFVFSYNSYFNIKKEKKRSLIEYDSITNDPVLKVSSIIDTDNLYFKDIIIQLMKSFDYGIIEPSFIFDYIDLLKNFTNTYEIAEK